jgi:DNA-binding beta-propeller fold protein YncE
MRKTSLAITVALLAACRGPTPIAHVDPPNDPGFGAVTSFVDPRASSVVSTFEPPPAISGGTLATRGTTVIAADPDRDRVLVVDLASDPAAVTQVALPHGSEPGRVVVDALDNVHVVLRGTGEVATLPLAQPTRVTRRRVCAAPRGIAVDDARQLVRVACRDGELVSFDPSTDATPNVLRLDLDDVRDILVRGDELIVTRFRSAEIVRLDQSGAELSRVTPVASVSPTTVRPDGSTAEFIPSVAWRAVLVDDDVFVAHQRSSDGELALAPGAYYSTGVCSGSIVQSGATMLSGSALTAAPSPNFAQATLPVDLAVSPDVVARFGVRELAVVGAGIQRPTIVAPSVARVPVSALADTYRVGCIYPWAYGNGQTPSLAASPEYTPNAIAAVYLPDGRLVVQGRDPSVLRVDGRSPVSLGGGLAFDTGHALFHADAGRGTACASCHPEGADDGRTWSFRGVGARRTPAVPPGFLTTAPFHWSGDLPDLDHLMRTVFTERMGGAELSSAQVAAVGGWLDTRPTPAARAGHEDDAAARGSAIFYGAGECSTCHSGAMLTSSATVDVGTGGSFQVPTLLGVSRRLPVMHDGCAQTLADRFEPACGGAAHGQVASLTTGDRDDLIAFLETL